MAKSPEQRAAEAFEKLRAKATDLGVVFTDDTTADELTALVDAAKDAAKAAKKSGKTSFTVYKNGEAVRTYSIEQHGEDAEDLANEFCAHSGDEVR